MIVLKSIILGIIQGLTEFLPVSSSGHLALFEKLFNMKSDNLFLETSMHMGTLFALIIYFKYRILDLLKNAFIEIKDKNENKKNIFFILYVIIGIIPASIVGLLFYSQIENVFHNLYIVSVLFFITSIILYLTKFSKQTKELNSKNSLLIGIAQIFALLPGISRSGITISSGLLLGLKGKDIADFSFFMAMPLILGSFLKELIDSNFIWDISIVSATLAAFISGYIAIVFLYKILKSDKFYLFSYYVLFISIITLLTEVFL